MQVEAMRLVLRPRTAWEGGDVGVRLLQASFKPVYTCYLVVAVPLFAILVSTYSLADWLPPLLIFWFKPWLDRTILFALSRTLFGAEASLGELWSHRGEVFWSQLLESLTLRRLSASRSFTQPVHQLEGLKGKDLRARLRVLSARSSGTARAVTYAYAMVETSCIVGLLVLPAWFGLKGVFDFQDPFRATPFLTALAYPLVVLFLEPFYVASGFGMYLNRRVELEAWDIEQEFRNAFGR